MKKDFILYSCISGNLSGGCLICIARRVSVPEKVSGMLGVEQFTTKQDLQGKILATDTGYVL